MRLANKIALITAAGSGMGRAGALLFAAEGAHVIVADIDATAAKQVVQEIEANGGSAEAVRVDIGDVDSLREMFDGVASSHGRLDVLWNHAGIPGPSGLDISVAEYEAAMNINTRGPFYATSFGLPLLRAAGRGSSVILTASVAGIVGSPLSPLYSMAKGGIVMFAKSLALMLGPEGIRVNAVCPGSTRTPMLAQFFGRDNAAGIEDRIDAFSATVPLGRTAEPSEIADAALFLASSESSFVTGIALTVDGGYTAR